MPGFKEAYGKCIRMAWPSALESVMISLIASVDTMMVGTMGSKAISAVGICSQPKFLLMAPIIALNTGVTAVVARRCGEGDTEGANRTLKQAIIVCALLGAVMTTIALLITKPLLELAGAQEEYIGEAVEYFRIVMAGQFFACLGLTINAAQRGVGNTKVSMRSNITANVVNIIFNYLLINGIWIFPKLGVKGAAVATALCSLTAFFMALMSVLKRDTRELTVVTTARWRFERATLSSVCKVSSSVLVEQVFLRFGFFIYAMIIARLGTVEFATHQICMQIINLSFSIGDGLGIASTSLVGQGLGMKRPDLSMIYGKIGQRLALCIGVTLSVVFVIFRRELIMLFSSEEAVIELGSRIVFIISAICLCQTSQVVISGCLRGAGDSRFVAVSSFICVGLIRTGFSYLLCYPLGLGLVGAWLGFLTDQALRLTLNFTRFKSAKWTKIEL